MRHRLLLLGGGLSAIGASYVGVSEQRRRKVSRLARFWYYSLPTYLHYRLVEYRVKGLPEAEQEAAFQALHETYAPLSLERILKMRGLYVKLGQIMTNRSDYAPPVS